MNKFEALLLAVIAGWVGCSAGVSLAQTLDESSIDDVWHQAKLRSVSCLSET